MEEEDQVAGRRGGGGGPPRKPQNQPVTAIDRFLWDHENHFSHGQPNSGSSRKDQRPHHVNDGPESNPAPFYYQEEGDRFLSLVAAGFEEPAISLVNGLFFLEQGVDGNSDENFQWASEKAFRKELAVEDYDKKNSTRAAAGKRVKRVCSKALIKGQWTEEEDR